MAGANPVYLPQSEDLQRALFGHAVAEERVFDAIVQAMEVVDNWGWISPYYTRLWLAFTKLKVELGKHPSATELKNAPEVLNEEPKMRERLEKELQRALDSRIEVDVHGLLRQLNLWQQAVLIDKQVTELARFYNVGDLPAARDVVLNLATKLEGLRDSISSRFMTAPERAALERDERILQAAKVMRYGITYFDEALGGISPNDLVLIGAKTGAGKTELVTHIARTNASSELGNIPKRVSFFALEAENHEIERRIKYSLLTRAFIANLQKKGISLDRGLLNYSDWRLGKLERELGPHEEAVQAHISKHFQNLRTYYRVSGHFGVAELEKSLIRAAKESELIILDHFHYVDTDGQNENAEAKLITKTLRDVVLSFGVPILVVAHLRKSPTGKYAPLMPGKEDFHGSSDLVKMATAAIILGPARGLTTSDNIATGAYPTFMRIGKSRLDGSREHTVGVGLFEPVMKRYRDKYAIGYFNGNETEWRCADPAKRPRWAKSGTILMSSTEGDE